MIQSIYLDNNASTAPLPAVREAMVDAIDRCYANPSSAHKAGQAAKQAVEHAREVVATFLNARYPSEIAFTGGATEAIARAFRIARPTAPGVIAISTVEHNAVIDAAGDVSHNVILIPVRQSGELDMHALERALADGACFVSIAWVNNETGVITDVAAVADLCRKAAAALHIDAAQAVGRVDIDVQATHCDYLSLSPHKFHGPKGVGILYSRAASESSRNTNRGQRGTPNVLGIVGTAAAVLGAKSWPQEIPRIRSLRDQLEATILAAIPGADMNGSETNRVANTSNIYFPRRNAADLVEALSRREVYVSAGAACSSGSGPSHVIRAMGGSDVRANSSVRFSLSRFTTSDEINSAVERVIDAYRYTLPTEKTT